MPLSDAAIRNAKPKEKPYKMADGLGMYLLVQPTGGKLWRLKYRVNGKEKLLSLGAYPDVLLGAAREKRDAARLKIAAGIDPAEIRKLEKRAIAGLVADSFESVAREWMAKRIPVWSVNYAAQTQATLERDLFPWIGSRPVAELTAPDLLGCLRRIEQRGHVETAHRVLGAAGQIFRYAVATGRIASDPSRDLKGALEPAKGGHYAAILEPVALGALLRDIDAYSGGLVVRSALQLLPMLFVRPGELRLAEWSEFDLSAAAWVNPGHKMKMKRDHIVPLSRQAVAVLKELQPLTGHRRHVFAGDRDNTRPISEAALNGALRRMGYNKDTLTAHGFRATARTLLAEALHFPPEVIEHQLAHKVAGPLGDAYNRTQYLDERRKMMQAWADYLDELRSGAQIVPLRSGYN